MCSLFFFTDPPTTEIYTLSLHDALPIFEECREPAGAGSDTHRPDPHARNLLRPSGRVDEHEAAVDDKDRKSTRLNSSHVRISYAVFCLKKKKKNSTHGTISQANSSATRW